MNLGTAGLLLVLILGGVGGRPAAAAGDAPAADSVRAPAPRTGAGVETLGGGFS